MKDLVKLTLAEQIYTILKDDIIHQEIKCGEKLTLKSLQERFDISSTPIRDAMNRLSQDGLIDHVTNVGAKVIELDSEHVREVYDFCCILDVAALKLACEGPQSQLFIEKLTASVDTQEEALNKGDILLFRDHSDSFHDLFFQYAKNSILYTASQKIRNQLSLLANKYQDAQVSKDMVLAEHRGILEALQKGRFSEAEALLKAHFESGKQYMLQCIEREEN